MATAAPGVPLTRQQKTWREIGQRVERAQELEPRLKGGSVKVNPDALERELDDYCVKAGQLSKAEKGAPGQATPAAQAEKELKEAKDLVAMLRAQRMASGGSDKRKSVEQAAQPNRVGAQQVASRQSDPGPDELPSEVLQDDPELAERLEPQGDGYDPAESAPADGQQTDPSAGPVQGGRPRQEPASAEQQPSAEQRPGTGRELIYAGSGRPGDGKVFDISTAARRAPRWNTRPSPTDTRPPNPHEGAQAQGPHARAESTRQFERMRGLRTPGTTQSPVSSMRAAA